MTEDCGFLRVSRVAAEAKRARFMTCARLVVFRFVFIEILFLDCFWPWSLSRMRDLCFQILEIELF
jgi:hypothetical protein